MAIYTAGAILRCHRECLEDEIRTERYRRAISETVVLGDRVLDAGTGTGILAFFACQAGATKVYAVDPSDIIEHAKQIALVNGLQDRIVFVKDLSRGARLTERVDVFIAGHIHNFALETGLLSSLIDARKRLLKESPRFIPQEIELSIVPVECPEIYHQVDFWSGDRYGLDLSLIRNFATNNCYKAMLDSGAFLSDPQQLVKIDSATVQTTFLSAQVSCIVNRSGTFHGIGGWFRAQLSQNVELSNDPRNKSAAWAQIFFPLTNPVPVEPGDQIEMTMTTNDGEVWRWKVEVGGEQSDQSTFFGIPIAKHLFAKKNP